jgi:hypothetical protein
MKANPEVRIIFSDLLYYGESQKIANSRGEKIKITLDECQKKTQAYRKEWARHEDKVLNGMQEIFGLNFYAPIIDAFLAPAIDPKSAPLILNFQYDPEEFVDVLIHELFHVLFTDNQHVNRSENKELIKHWSGLFGNIENTVELVHIPVHAGLKAIYLDVLKEPYRLERDIKECQQWPSYKAAWEYVEKNDYKKIIRDFKKSYKTL